MIKKRWLSIFVAFFTAILLAACGNEENASGTKTKSDREEITIKHELGETKVKKKPEKVVVFDFGVLDSLDKLGVEVAGVPQANIPSYLEKYKDSKYENVGGLMEPDFEKISEIAPDLIIISGRQADSYEKFAEIAPTVYMGIDTKNYMDSFTNNMKTLGKIFGKEKEVEKELARINEQIEAVKAKTEKANGKALIVLTTGGKVSAYGPGSRFGIIHDVLGIQPVDANIKVSPHGQSISFEYIAEKNPDYLFVVDRDAVVEGKPSAKQTIENELVKKTNAYKNNRIIYLNPNYWYLSGGGLISVTEMINEVEKGIE